MPNQTRCEVCPVHTTSSSSGNCAPCDGNTVPNLLATACIKCPSNQKGVGGVCQCRPDFYNASAGWLECVEGDAAFNQSEWIAWTKDVGARDLPCRRCPVCAHCDTGVPQILPGFTELPASSNIVLPALVRVAFRCDLHSNGEHSDTCNETSRSRCSGGSEGLFCQSCTPGYHTVQFECAQCEEASATSVVVILGVLACSAFAWWRQSACVELPRQASEGAAESSAEYLFANPAGQHESHGDAQYDLYTPEDAGGSKALWWLRLNLVYHACFQPMRMIITWAQVSHNHNQSPCNTPVPVQVALTYDNPNSQITSQIGSVLQFHYPPVFLSAVDALRFMQDIWSLFFDSECNGMSGFRNQWLLKVAAPLFVLAVATAYSFLAPTGPSKDSDSLNSLKQMEEHAFTQFGTADHRFTAINRQRVALDDRVNGANARNQGDATRQSAKSHLFGFVFLVYPSVVNTALAAFECRDIIAGQSTGAVLEADDRLQCDSSEVASLQLFSLVVIVVFAFGVPVGSSVLLIRNAHEYAQIDTELNAQIARRLADEFQVDESVADFILRDVSAMGQTFSFIMDAYSFRHYYWESLDLVRKLLLVGLVLLLGRGSVAQIIVALMLSFGFFALHMRTWPYKLYPDNLFRAATEMHGAYCMTQSQSPHCYAAFHGVLG